MVEPRVVASVDTYRRPPGTALPVGVAPALVARLTVPRRPAVLVSRPRLERRLTDLTDAGTTLVTAGPGEGKTALVAAWAEAGAAPGTVGWLTLDRTDADPATFWSDVLAALRWTGVPLGDGGPRPLEYADGGTERHIDRIHALLYDLTTPIVLVLDGIHELHDPSVLARLDALLTQPPPAMRLVLLGRADPGLRLHRLRLDGLLGEIHAPDLRFDRAEAGRLLSAHGLRLDAGQTDRLLARTGGWAAGLRLAAMSVDPADPATGLARFSGESPAVADYLAGEVLAPLPPPVRSFLLRTSVAEPLSGPLAAAVSGQPEGRRLLTDLTAGNRLVSAADPWGRPYDYHPLLREYLYHRLRAEDPAGALDAHRRAARWYGAHRAPVTALWHAVRSGDTDEVARVLFTLALPRLLSAEGAQLADTVRPLADAADDAPSLVTLTCAAVAAVQRHDFARARAHLRRARATLPGVPAGLRDAADIGLSLVDAIAAGSTGAVRAARTGASRVLSLAGPDARPGLPAAAEYRALARWNLGRAQLWQGGMAAADASLRDAATAAGHHRLDLAAVSADAHRAVIDVVRGELRSGTRRARSTVLAAERQGRAVEPYAAGAFLALALAELQQDHPHVAARHLARAGASAAAGADRTLDRAVRLAEARLRVQAGDAAAARRILAELRADSGNRLPALLTEWLAGAEAEAELAAGAPDTVLEHLRADPDPGVWERIWLGWADLALRHPAGARARVAPLGRSPDRGRAAAVEESLITALAADALRQDGVAVEAVDRALELAAPDRLSHPFRTAGNRLAPLIRRQQRVLGTHAAFAEMVLTDQAAPPAERLAEPLTDRELTVLRYLPTMSSNDEIAGDLHISVNTVKAHLKSLYRKLAVSSRREAIRRGRLLGLLRPSGTGDPDGLPDAPAGPDFAVPDALPDSPAWPDFADLDGPPDPVRPPACDGPVDRTDPDGLVDLTVSD
ncbi:LuxR family transcriptional regulator [Actinocatenispora rupis]|uniref:Transcriptional regulator n=1 Tax=Actinocatenispora rupis TaxID=519421 RepID=A0A8J3J8Z3_9ACTN|nr:transcriptional regulator [Actinocatenispora rupis]